MSVYPHVFPFKGRRLGASPSHLVFITAALSGLEVRNPEREGRRVRFNAAAGIKKLSDWETLSVWHAAHEGQTYGFLIKDWLDFEATRAAKTLYSDGGVSVTSQGRATALSGATHQLEKWYSVGALTFKRKVTRPVSGTVQVYFDGVLKAVTTDYTIDYATGVLTVVSGSPTVISWTGEFYVPVRFEEPALPQIDLTLYRDNGTGNVEFPDVMLIEDIE